MDREFRKLVIHFFSRFFDRESRAEDSDPWTGVIQWIACLSVPGLLLSFFLTTDHPTGLRGDTSELARIWLRTGDRYVFVCYAMVVMGFIMTLKWDTLFPDRRDYLILTPQPISTNRLFLAKTIALCAFLSLFVIAINLFSLLIMPAVYASKAHSGALADAFLAHALGTIGGSIFTALAFASLQGVLINVLTPRAFRRISPSIQMIAISMLVLVLLIIPLVKETIPQSL